MAIFSVSDVVIAATLLINALALLSSRKKVSTTTNENRKMTRLSSFARLAQALSQKTGAGKSSELNLEIENAAAAAVSDSPGDSVGGSGGTEGGDADSLVADNTDNLRSRIQKLLLGVRKYSCVLIFWNVIYFILMIFVFNR
jgi:hypothetical protein